MRKSLDVHSRIKATASNAIILFLSWPLSGIIRYYILFLEH
jgi:hypothetical protein